MKKVREALLGRSTEYKWNMAQLVASCSCAWLERRGLERQDGQQESLSRQDPDPTTGLTQLVSRWVCTPHLFWLALRTAPPHAPHLGFDELSTPRVSVIFATPDAAAAADPAD